MSINNEQIERGEMTRQLQQRELIELQQRELIGPISLQEFLT